MFTSFIAHAACQKCVFIITNYDAHSNPYTPPLLNSLRTINA